MDLCTDYHFLEGLLIVKYFIRIALIVVPIILIVLASIDSIKALISGNNAAIKDIFVKMGKRICCVAIILMIPDVLFILFNSFSSFSTVANNIAICYQNAETTMVSDLKRARLNELEELNQEDTEEYIVEFSKDKFVNDPSESVTSSSTSLSASNTSATNSGNFTKYSLSDAQLRGIAYQCYKEQGTAKGAAAEASLMANRFELYNQGKYGEGADGLFNYVKSSGWFAGSQSNLSNTSYDDAQIIAAVRAVLVEGKRTLPGYVDEHDCFSDISSATNNGTSINVSDRSAYQANVTKLYNVYDSSYTFYSFPDTNSDPFGYLSEENRAQIGEEHYAFEDLGV